MEAADRCVAVVCDVVFMLCVCVQAMICCIGMSQKHHDETLSALRYADRAAHLKTKPRVNNKPSRCLLRQMLEWQHTSKDLAEEVVYEDDFVVCEADSNGKGEQPTARPGPVSAAAHAGVRVGSSSFRSLSDGDQDHD